MYFDLPNFLAWWCTGFSPMRAKPAFLAR